MPEYSDTDNAALIAATAQQAVAPHPVDADQPLVFVLPEGARVEVVDSDKLRDKPRRKKGTAVLLDPVSLSNYVATHNAGDGAAALYADPFKATVVALLNGASEAQPGWGDHRATLTLRKTPEWQAWEAFDRKEFEQTAFAEHVEAQIADIVDPPGADLLELAMTFEATTEATFRSATRLNNGERQLRYEENVEAKAGRAGEITVPEQFTLALAPFEGSEAYQLRARLRYRVNGGNLKIGYTLLRPDLVLRKAFDEVVGQIEQATSLTAYLGSPPA